MCLDFQVKCSPLYTPTPIYKLKFATKKMGFWLKGLYKALEICWVWEGYKKKKNTEFLIKY